VGVGIFTVQNGVMWTPLQRWYWGQYLNTEVFPTRASDPHGHYRLLAKVDRRGQQRMAVDADVVPTRLWGGNWYRSCSRRRRARREPQTS